VPVCSGVPNFSKFAQNFRSQINYLRHWGLLSPLVHLFTGESNFCCRKWFVLFHNLYTKLKRGSLKNFYNLKCCIAFCSSRLTLGIRSDYRAEKQHFYTKVRFPKISSADDIINSFYWYVKTNRTTKYNSRNIRR
jgi:hypothetical protein